MDRRGFALLPALVTLLAAVSPAEAGGPVGQSLVVGMPCRVVDTRGPAGPLGGPALGPNEVRILPIAGTCGVPADALGLAVNITVTQPTGVGFAKLLAGDLPTMPDTTVLNFSAGQTRASNAMVSLASDGSGTIALVNGSNGTAHYIIDIVGHFVTACTSTITVTNPGTTAGTVNAPFSQTFTSAGGTGTMTYTTSSTLPAGLTLATNGTLSGTPTQSGTFPIVVTATDANGCSGTGSTYTLVISCQTITVTPPATTTGTANVPFTATFTQVGGVGTTTFSTSSPLPTGLTLASNGVLSGTPTQAGGFPITVTATDANGCTGKETTYVLVINCQSITVTNPAITTGTAGSLFSQTFTQAGAIGTATFTTASTLPAGLALAANGVLSGTPTVTGTFPIVVTVKDANLCTGTGATYNLVINCQTIGVSNPAVATATANTPFSQQFTATGAIGGATFTTASTLPTGLTLATNGVLSGTPTQTGSFPIVVMVTDANGCAGIGATYNLVVGCQTYGVEPSAIPQGADGVAYAGVTFSAPGGIGTVAFGQTGALPTGMNFTGGVLSGTPTQTGLFPITVTATDANGCTASRDYLLVVTCTGTTIALSPGTLPTVPANAPFPSTQFTASGGTGPYTFQQVGTLPNGMQFLTDTLSGTPTQTGTFPITVAATDAGGCVGSQDYVITVTCVGTAISVLPATVPGGTAGTAYAGGAGVPFSGTGGTAPYVLAEAGVLPAGMTFAGGILSGTPTGAGTFPFTVTATDANGCSGQTNYSLVIACQPINVTNPVTTTATEGNLFDQQFTATGILGTVTWSTASTLPNGLTLNPSTGHLTGTPTQTGPFPIVVKATDTNGCFGTSATYTLVVTCPPITVSGSIPALTYGMAMTPTTFSQIGTSSTVTWSATGLPGGVGINPSTGQVSGVPFLTGTFSVTITATDAGGCTGSTTLPVAVLPIAPGQAYMGVGNTQLYVTGVAGAPTTPAVATAVTLLNGAQPAGGVAVSAASCSFGGTITTFDAAGRFVFTPNVTAPSATCTYTISSNTGGTATPTTATASLTFILSNRVWYVDSASGGTQDGRSNTPFLTLAAVGGAGTASGDFIYVSRGAGFTNGAYAMLPTQQLIGAGATLNVPTASPILTVPGNPANTPTLSGTLTLANGVTVNGIDMNTGSSSAITGTGVTGVSVTARNVTTTTGTAISLGGSGNGGTMTFTSVNVGTAGGGPSNGIVLTNYNGSFTVLGDGSNTANGSGGTIQRTTGNAVSLTNVTGASASFNLSSMVITNSTGDGINGTSVANFSLQGCQITSNGSASANNGVHLFDATGTATFTNVTVTGSKGHNAVIDATNSSTAVLTSLTVMGGSYSSSAGGDGFLIQMKHSAAINTGSFTGVTFSGNASWALDVVGNDNSTLGDGSGAPGTGTITVSGSTFTNNNGGGVSFAQGGGSGTSFMYARFVNNTLTGNKSHAINVVSGATSAGGTQKVLISGNTIGNAGVVGSGSAIGEGIVVTEQGEMIGTVTIVNNVIRQVPNGRGIDVQALGSVNLGLGATPLDVSITGNDVNPQDTSGFPLYAIYVAADDQGSPTLVHAAVHDNTVPSTSACDTSCSASTGMIWYEVVTPPSTGTLFNFGGNATVSDEIANTNTGTSGKTTSPNTGLSLTSTPVNTVP